MSIFEINKSTDHLEREIFQLRQEITSLKNKPEKVNREVCDSENLFHSIFEDASIGMALIDKNSGIVKFNKSFLNLFGYEQDEIVNLTYLDLIPDKKKERVTQFIEAMFSSKLSKYQTNQEFIKKDQSIIWFNLTSNVILDLNGNPEYILGMGEDITESKRQEKIREVVYTISNAVNCSENLNTLISTIKENLNLIIDSTHFFIALYNESTDEFRIPCILDHKETFKTFQAEKTLVGYVQKNKKSVLYNNKEILELEAKGEIFISNKLSKQWMGVTLISDEKVIGVMGVKSYDNESAFDTNDLTILEIVSNQISASVQKIRSQDALKIERAYFKELFDNSPEAIAIVNNSSIIMDINSEFTHLFGYSKEEAINQSIEDLISIPDFKIEAQELTTEIAKGKVIKIETKRRKKNNSMVDVSLWGTPIMLDEGQIAVYAIFRDISEKVEAEQKLEEAKEKAEESDRLKTSFLTNMSHEIRTPMNAIIGFSELISEPGIDQDTRKEFGEQIFASSKMLLTLIDDIIDISKLDSGNLKLSRKKFNISNLLTELHSKFDNERLKDEKNNIELLLHNPFGDSIAYIESDDFRFNQIFSHLLSNALKYTNDGFIEFGFDINQQEEPIFYVRDTGIGIPEDKTDTIFNHFTKIEDRTRLYRGTGIGLTITKKLVNLLGGEIWVESNIGIGSIFYFTLPGKVSLFEIKQNNNTHCKNYNWSGKKLLIAEDEDTNYEVVKASLAHTHTELHRAINGKEAIKKCMDIEFDIVLMDIRMPIIDGIEATQQIKAFKPNLPIIAQTAYVLKNERDLCINAGCDDYITKPIKSYVLLEILNKYINGK